ncbi:MAG: hypothetical protein ISN26_01675 [Betaproteobacteria bacterium AqS2]|uniref:Uncharacterized protein n=1 Tax=Candidatus Amphirhobacter heronislandensis TaxID=1732024 RepID=A0A930UFG1_9GAMM|nr:hypothetical protein [Betaproteobacteria bacterium AqS2]
MTALLLIVLLVSFAALYGRFARADEKKVQWCLRRLQEKRNPLNQIVHPPGYAGAMLVAIWRDREVEDVDDADSRT